MTDQPRGAYTPQQDVPLQFDPRSPASRRPMPMALIASGTLLVVLIAAVAMYYSRGVRGEGEPPRPVGEPVATLKSAPAATAQPADPDGLDVSAPQNVPGKAPVFAAAPEAPKPRPAPAAPTKLTVQTLSAAEMGKSESAPAIVATPSAKTAAVKAPAVKTVTTAATTVTPAPEVPAPPIAKPVVAKAASAAKTPTPAPEPKAATVAATSASGARVQIGAFSSAALADKGYSDVSALLSGSMSGKAKHVEPVQKDGATLYRTSVTGFADRASATAFCEALKAKGKICFVKN
jgi:cell division septation protein DedD